MPYRELPEGFEKTYLSSWFTLPFPKVADAGKSAQCYNWTLGCTAKVIWPIPRHRFIINT